MRIAVIGCGAIADSFHIPALLKGAMGDATLVLVDPSVERAQALAEKHGVAETAASHGEVADRLDAAIVASPHHTHVPIAMDLLEAGVPVLSEKPLGTSVEEVTALMNAARSRDLPVAVNQTRRFIPACREIHRLVQAGELGEIRSLDAVEGDKFGWPAATPAMFGLRSGGKGVLLDIGVHVLDLVTWWLGDDLQVDSYRDDSFDGSEAAVRLEMSSGDLRVTVGLSWLAKQRNSYVIEGSEAVLEWGVYDLNLLTLRSVKTGRTSKIRLSGPREFAALAPEVIGNFHEAVTRGAPVAVTPEDALPSMRLIEACYGARERFEMPWHSFEGATHGG